MRDDVTAVAEQRITEAPPIGLTGLARVGWWWRRLACGFCFLVYGAAAWLGGMTVLPLIMLWPATPEKRERRIRRVVSWSFRWLLGLVSALRVGDTVVEGREWLAQADGKLLVANHPMYLDVLALVGAMPQADCVIKHALWRNRWYRHFVQASGYISNASSAGLIDDCVASLQRGRTLILFPEGTRSTPGQRLRFQRGAAQIAVRSGCDVMPVIIRCEPLGLGKGQSWYDAPVSTWKLHLTICPPQKLTAFGWHEGLPHGVAARRVNHAMEAFFSERLKASDASPEDA